jgi:hypothetical protein
MLRSEDPNLDDKNYNVNNSEKKPCACSVLFKITEIRDLPKKFIF